MAAKKAKTSKFVYAFGPGKADGSARQRNLLGGKGANLAEMCRLGLPVPAGFTISTEVCTWFMQHEGRYPKGLEAQVSKALARVERQMDARFGDSEQPLLVSVRSGARSSMPGMMETVLNIGLNDQTVETLAKTTGNPRFAWDAYRRLLMMYADVVMEKAGGVTLEGDEEGIRKELDKQLEAAKKRRGVKNDSELGAETLKRLCGSFQRTIAQRLGSEFPQDPMEQLWGAIGAVFKSWNGKRAISYRRIEGIPDEWGTAVNVQAMVFGNMGEDSATGVAFTRDPGSGENRFYGEWLPNAQGEDVVAGIRTPHPLNEVSRSPEGEQLSSLEQAMPKLYRQLARIRTQLEKHYRDMQDLEFTIQQGRLWMLQTRSGKRNGVSAVRMAAEMARSKLITPEEALLRVKPAQLDELLHPMLDPEAERASTPLAKGLPAGPGGASGRVVFSADAAEEWAGRGERVILVREETSPEDVHGMHAAQAILTAKGGMTSHAALVARGWGKCCIVGAGAVEIDARKRMMQVGDQRIGEGEWLTLNGSRGLVYEGQLPLIDSDPQQNKHYKQLMKWADQTRRLGVRTNADSPDDSAQARSFGAEGIGLCRTEHMFFEPARIKAIRELIVADSAAARRDAIMKLLPYQRKDFEGIFEAMNGLPVTIRFLDPPLHEFVPHEDQQIRELASELGVGEEKLRARIEQLKEANPMLGHRGCRLVITYPEIAEMQARAIFEAASECKRRRVKVHPEIMIPLVGGEQEFERLRELVDRVAEEVRKQTRVSFPYLVGANIELPRACVTADRIAQQAEFFSFGTNDLTQTTCGLSRDDAGSFLPSYVEHGLMPADPFQSLDQQGVGQLVRMAVERGRSTRKDLLVGVCGEHGGEPASVEFFHHAGLDYVSCSPFRVPIARLAAAQAALRDPKTKRSRRAAGTSKATRGSKKKAPAKRAAGRGKPARKPARRR